MNSQFRITQLNLMLLKSFPRRKGQEEVAYSIKSYGTYANAIFGKEMNFEAKGRKIS